MDIFTNFSVATVSTGYPSTAGKILLQTNHGLKLPDITKPVYAVWWNATDYVDPTDDPNVEIIQITKKTNDTLFIRRGRFWSIPSNKNTNGKTYRIAPYLDESILNRKLYYFKNPSKGSYYFNDIEHGNITGNFDVFTTVNTPSIRQVVASENGHTGILQLGSTAGAPSYFTPASNFIFGVYDLELTYWFKFSYLNGSDGTYNFYAGFQNTTSFSLTPTNGAFFMIAAGTNKLQFRIRDASSTILTEDLIIPKANTWYELKIRTFKENICEVYVNKTLLKRYINQLPADISKTVGTNWGLDQVSGGEISIFWDAYEFICRFRNERTAAILNS